MLTPLTPIKAQPVQGGAVTVRNAAQLPFGSYSMVQNVRGKHPNFIKRSGQRKLHSTADGSNEVLSLYQFRKSRVDETHLFAQMSDGDILEATNDPPTVTTGAFGSEVFDGSANQIPASWSSHADKLIVSNGVDQHQIYCGTESYVEKFIKYNAAVGDTEIPDMPRQGADYSTEVRNTRSDVADISGLLAITAFECVYIRVPVPVIGFTFTMVSANSNACVAAIQYYNSTAGWTSVANLSDGTVVGAATLGQSGAMAFDTNANIPRLQFGSSGFWYRLVFDSTLSATVTIKTVTFQSEFQDIVNVWDGVTVPAVECQVHDFEWGTWSTYGSGAVDLSSLDSLEKFVLASADPIEGIYIEVDNTPSGTAAVITVKYWNGTEFTSVSGLSDGTSDTIRSFCRTGWITFDRQTDAEQHQFNTTHYHAYWYEVSFNNDLGAETVVAVSTMPYFDIDELGKSQCSTVWKERAVYSFDEYPQYLYISKAGYPLVLNGSQFGILVAGDGRNNEIVNMKSYKDWLIAFQEEKGVEGGCVTVFSGSSPSNYTKSILSTRIGAMNAKSVAVVEGVETATADTATALEEKIATLVFFLSNKGVCVTNGYTIDIISDDIQNYFDSSKDECIRRGYESKMWLAYDSAHGVIRIGLVSGALATKANVFPVYDLADKTWSFDVLGQKFACLTEVEAGSGNIPVLQLGGGQEDGTIYQSNYGLNDVNEAIHTFTKMELNYNGEVLNLQEFLIRFSAQEYGEVIIEFLKNNLHEMFKTVSMLPEKPGQIIKRERFNLNITDQNISIKISAGEFNTEMELIEMGMITNVWSGV
jgi:hypothetical protein